MHFYLTLHLQMILNVLLDQFGPCCDPPRVPTHSLKITALRLQQHVERRRRAGPGSDNPPIREQERHLHNLPRLSQCPTIL